MDEYSLRSRFEGSGTKDGLDNSDIIAIVGIFASIFASIIATLCSVWLLDKFRKRYNRQRHQERAAESLEANVNQGSPSHETSSTSAHFLQDLEASASIQSAQTASTIISGTEIPQEHGPMVRSAPIGNGSSSHLREALEHLLEGGINRPEQAYTWNADRAVLVRPGVGASHNKD